MYIWKKEFGLANNHKPKEWRLMEMDPVTISRRWCRDKRPTSLLAAGVLPIMKCWLHGKVIHSSSHLPQPVSTSSMKMPWSLKYEWQALQRVIPTWRQTRLQHSEMLIFCSVRTKNLEMISRIPACFAGRGSARRVRGSVIFLGPQIRKTRMRNGLKQPW